jgi:hypothetical protein
MAMQHHGDLAEAKFERSRSELRLSEPLGWRLDHMAWSGSVLRNPPS